MVTFFANEGEMCFGHVFIFIAINIPCKFGEDIFRNKWYIKDIRPFGVMTPLDLEAVVKGRIWHCKRYTGIL